MHKEEVQERTMMKPGAKIYSSPRNKEIHWWQRRRINCTEGSGRDGTVGTQVGHSVQDKMGRMQDRNR